MSGTTTAGTDYGQISVAGAATLSGGTVSFVTATGFSPAIGTQFTILKAGSVSGTFGTVTGAVLSDRQYVLSYNATSVVATVEPLAPTVSGVSPTSGPAAGGTSVTITGTNLDSATGVKFGATAAASFTVNSATQITATAPAGIGTVDVTVTNPGGTSSTSVGRSVHLYPGAGGVGREPDFWPCRPAARASRITGTEPDGCHGGEVRGDCGDELMVNSATQITATAPAGTGTVDVTVTTRGGTSGTSSADQYSYVAAPAVSGISPASGPGAGGTSVTITGTNLSGASAVMFGSTAATTFTVNSATQITATAPAGSGMVDVTVATPGGTSATSAADQYSYVPMPAVSGVSPAGGPVAGGTTVMISGSGFSGCHGGVVRIHGGSELYGQQRVADHGEGAGGFGDGRCDRDDAGWDEQHVGGGSVHVFRQAGGDRDHADVGSG